MPDLAPPLRRIADRAKLIVRGYAFTPRRDGLVDILDLGHPDSAMVVTADGELVETNMDPVEQALVADLCRRNLPLLRG